MKNILLPMDFTEVGVNALRYALHAFPNASYSVLHVRSNLLDMSEPFPVKEQKLPLDTGIFTEQDWRDAMYKFIKASLNIEQLPPLLTVSIKYGAIQPEIEKYTYKIEFDLIMMGTRDKYNYFDKLLGTVSYLIAKSSSIPLYLIPRHATFSGIERALVAIDYNVESTEYLSKFKIWNEEYSAFARFVYVNSSEEHDDSLNVEAIKDELYKGSDPKFDFEIAEWKGKKIGKSLLAEAYNFKSDILVVMPERKGLLGSIFFRSISKDLIIKAQLPLLFLNSKQN